ncbi:MAG TPA: hypothetical protein VFH83_09585 [Spirochaetia bacterium]|nr:hypothetical protein [Spirochaetia bacterium]
MQGSRRLTKITRYSKEGKRRSVARAYRARLRGALLSLARTVMFCATPEQVDAAAALAQLVCSQGITSANYLLFLTLLETNNVFVVDVLVGDRNPFLLFAPIKPNWYLLRETFRILAKYKGHELSEKALLALLGVVQNAYKTSKDGYKIYPLSVADVYSLGKHLDKDGGQGEPRNQLLLDILYDIYFVAIDSEDRGVIRIGIKANDIRMAFFDHTKRMVDALPDVLLVQDVPRLAVGPRSFSRTATPESRPLPPASQPTRPVSRSRKPSDGPGKAGRTKRRP